MFTAGCGERGDWTSGPCPWIGARAGVEMQERQGTGGMLATPYRTVPGPSPRPPTAPPPGLAAAAARLEEEPCFSRTQSRVCKQTLGRAPPPAQQMALQLPARTVPPSHCDARPREGPAAPPSARGPVDSVPSPYEKKLKPGACGMLMLFISSIRWFVHSFNKDLQYNMKGPVQGPRWSLPSPH